MALQPPQPPTGADFAALVAKVNEVATKAGVAKLSATITKAIPAWKRYVGGEAEFDGSGIRDVVTANAIQQNQMKTTQDTHSQAILELRAAVQELKEAPAAHPFP